VRLAALPIALACATAIAGPARRPSEAERGLVALRAGKLAAADALEREAIAHAATPLAASIAHYNLGLVQEAEGDRDAAIVSYVESLRARPSARARERLARLDRELADGLDPFATEPLAGPFTSLAEFAVREERRIGRCRTDVASYEVVRAFAAASLAPPYRGAATFRVACDGPRLFVGVQLADGWYVGELDSEPLPQFTRCASEPKRAAIAVARVAGATPRLRVTYAVETICVHHGDTWGSRERAHVVIGVGASNTPAATARIFASAIDWNVDDSGRRREPKRTEKRRAVAIAWHRDGSFTIRRVAGTVEDDLVGRHAPRFR
jgi:hypothetical protein